MRILVGIGNPGPTYAATRHNVGWFVLDALAARHSEIHEKRVRWEQGEGNYLVAHVISDANEYVLVKPLTYVNLSGDAVLTACDVYSAESTDLLIIVDDAHLSPGELRLRQGGTSGGHNGLVSVIEALGTQKVPRLRIGVGAPPRYGALVEHVLSPFTPEEIPIIHRAVENAVDIALAFGNGGFADSSSVYSRWKQQNASNAEETDDTA